MKSIALVLAVGLITISSVAIASDWVSIYTYTVSDQPKCTGNINVERQDLIRKGDIVEGWERWEFGPNQTSCPKVPAKVSTSKIRWNCKEKKYLVIFSNIVFWDNKVGTTNYSGGEQFVAPDTVAEIVLNYVCNATLNDKTWGK